MKGQSAAAMLAMLGQLRALRPSGTLLIVNDRIDVALAGGADGVHLGQDDLPLAAARAVCLGAGRPDFLLGISTHNETQAAAAAAADYIAVGPIYPTSSKQNPDPVVGVERLAAICRDSRRPIVAIGGITLERVPEVVTAGAHSAAIIAAVNGAADVAAAARQVQRAFIGG
jgi:thiamine-phosphate pyrophosphorylase